MAPNATSAAPAVETAHETPARGCEIGGMSKAEITALAVEAKRDALAFERLVRVLRSQVWRVCCKFRSPLSDLDDLRQEALIALWKAVVAYDPERDPTPGGDFAGFAGMFMRRAALTRLRMDLSQKRQALVEGLKTGLNAPLRDRRGGRGELGDIVPDPAAASPEERFLAREAAQEAIMRMSELERRVVLLSAAGYSYDEAAARLGRSRKSVDNAVQRGREKAARVRRMA